MRLALYILLPWLIIAFGGCERNGYRETVATPSQPIKKLPNKQTEPVELVVRLCTPLESGRIAAIATRYGVSVKKQPSPTLLVFTWNDQRTAGVLINELQAEEDICAVEVNQVYHTTQPPLK